MARSSFIFASLTAAAVLAGLGAAQDTPQNASKSDLTARELYYAAAAPSQSPAPAPPAQKAQTKPIQAKNTATPSRPVEVAVNTPTKRPQPPTPSTPTQTDSTTTTPPRPQEGGELPGGGRIVNASTTVSSTTAPVPNQGPALGLKYSILKEIGSDYVEVAPNTIFHAGDHIRFNVESNSPGYLYIVLLGSSGNWRPMFPASNLDNGNNHIEAFHSYTMPPQSRLTFDEQTGEEKFFIVLSRDPEPDLERMIYTLQEGGSTTSPVTQPATPAAPKNPPLYKPDNTGSHQKLMASTSIDNNTIGRLRNAYARDLIVETITDQTAGDRKEKAVYVVNPSGSKDSRLAADLTLVHK